MKQLYSNQGFTLLEMMVSISILALVLVAVFQIQSSTLRLSVSGEFYSTASHLARKKMADIEQILNDPSMSNELSANQISGDFGDQFSGYKWECLISSFDISGSQIPEEVIAKSELQQLKNITIQISYKDELSFKISSWRFIQNR
ncbi:MAG: prepilin-type N-terminal cleavage/methylation domain-containing protein [Desulfamplus sp.]|nr:prepilin-type N-terminal cleavage/methylation domain-containing protein [Desulfamplus sp.]